MGNLIAHVDTIKARILRLMESDPSHSIAFDKCASKVEEVPTTNDPFARPFLGDKIIDA